MMISFGQRLKVIRKGVQLTQAELAEKLMVSVQSISKWECDNAMPDISQIVPLSAILGVTTDCLLGVGGDEKADRENLYKKVEKINKGIERVYWRHDNAYYECYQLYKEHIKKYPLDFEIKLLCADSLIRCLYYGAEPKEEKDKFYQEAITILKSVINCDRDTTRLIDAQQTLVILYDIHIDTENITDDMIAGLEYAISTLPPRDQRVIRLRYGEKMTRTAIGKEFDVTGERIRTVEGRAMIKLRRPPLLGYIKYGKVGYEKRCAEIEAERKKNYDEAKYQTEISTWDIPVRAQNRLIAKGYRIIKDIVALTEAEIIGIQYLGRKSITDIARALEELEITDTNWSNFLR